MVEPDLHPIEASHLHARRERVFLVLAGLFLGTLAMLNLLGITRFLDMSFEIFGISVPFIVPVGVLPYPITFLCTDFISEFYGRKRANLVVWVGLMLNLWVVLILWLGSVLPPEPDPTKEPELFFRIKELTYGAVTASMIAYLAAQFCDVYLFHFWKRLTRGKHLWLRNNGSTLLSQLVDTVAVILITYFYAKAIEVKDPSNPWPDLLTIILSAYVFKMVVALVDTLPFYVGAHYLARYLRIDPFQEHQADVEETSLS